MQKIVRKQQKEPAVKIDVQSQLKERFGVQLVRRQVLSRYIEFDRKTQRVTGKGTTYLKKLKKEIVENGLLMPLILAVSRLTERAYLFEGNHRMVILEELQVPWVPLKINYFFQNDDHDRKYNFTLRPLQGNFPVDPTPEDMGFEVQILNPLSYTSSDEE